MSAGLFRRALEWARDLVGVRPRAPTEAAQTTDDLTPEEWAELVDDAATTPRRDEGR